jgi:serine/threonine protein kinase
LSLTDCRLGVSLQRAGVPCRLQFYRKALEYRAGCKETACQSGVSLQSRNESAFVPGKAYIGTSAPQPHAGRYNTVQPSEAREALAETGVPVPGDKHTGGSVDLGRLETVEWQRLQDILGPFEAAWQAATGPDGAVDLGPFLPPAGDPLRAPALQELIKADLEFRWRRGQGTCLESYLERFPELGPPPPPLIYEEYRARQCHGDRLPLADYEARFPEQFAELQRLVQEDPIPTVTGLSQTHAGGGPVAPPPSASGYDILGELGRGGMGIVYKALDRKHQKVVALKTVQGLDPGALYRFKQEFRALAGLAHPNLVTLHELVADAGQCFFTMELVEGVDFLSHVRAPSAVPSLASTTTLPPAFPPRPAAVNKDARPAVALAATQLGRLRTALAQLAEGVLALHAAGTLHRDIKPSNVKVTPDGRVVLLDFGLAADLDQAGLHQSTEQHILGTVAYMAPEQAASQPVSAASDWYAVGVMLYEALTGRLPFTGPPLQVLMHKQQQDPPAPTELAAGVPEDLNTLCVELLRRDPQARPLGEEVRRRLQFLADGPTEAAPVPAARRLPPAKRVPLVGRERHLRALAEAFEAVRQGRTVTVCVHGRSGAGKTALVQRFLTGLGEGGGAAVLAGRCYEQESVPYKALDSVLDALSRHLARLPLLEAQALLPRDVQALARVFPVLRRVEAVAGAPRRGGDASDPQEARRRASAALRELLGRLSDRRPLVLAIDDLQWGDADSAALLADLLQPPDPPALLLLASYRSEDVAGSPCLRGLLQQLGTSGHDRQACAAVERRELAVEPLSPEEGRELALVLLGEDDAAAQDRAAAVARESGGNPFFVYELVQHLGRAGDDTGPLAAPALPDVLWGRVERLPEAQRQLVEVIAVAGWPVPQTEACRAAGWDAGDLTALAYLRADRLLRRTGTAEQPALETYHDRIRETVTARLEPAVRALHHRRLAVVLEASGRADAEVLAVHFQGAGEPGRAGHYYARAAAQAAEALAFDRAAKLYRLALELQGPQGDEERVLRTSLADALANAGRGADSGRQYLEAAEGAPPAEALELRRRAALQFLISGHIDDGLAALRAVLAAVGMRLPRTSLGALWGLVWRRLYVRLRGLGYRRRGTSEVPPEELTRINVCWSAAAGLSMVTTVEGAYFQTRGLLLALRAGEPYALARALALEAGHVSTGGGRTRRRTAQLLEAADALAREVGRPYARGLVALSRGIAAALAGDWPEGRARCDEAEGIFRASCTGVVWELDTAHRFALWPLMFMGDVPEMNRRLAVLLKEAQERDDLYALTNLGLVLRTFTRLAADEPERARDELGQVMALWSQQGFHVQHMNRLHDEVQIDLYQGEGLSAWQRLTSRWPLLVRSHLLRVQQVRIFLTHLRARSALAAAVRSTAPDPFLRAAERDARLLEREQLPWADALAVLVRAGLGRLRGDQDAAPQLRRGVERCEATAMRLYAASARRWLGCEVGGAAGEALTTEADVWLAAQQVRNPSRLAALLVPGFADRPAGPG